MAGRSSNGEFETRIRVVQEWIMQDNTWADIIKSCISKWAVGNRQAERYYSAAYAAFAEGEEKNIEAKRSYYLARKRRLMHDMAEKTTPAGTMVLSKIIDSMAELEGVKFVKSEDNKPIHIVIDNLDAGVGVATNV